MFSIINKKVTILGLQRSGLAAAKWALDNGAIVRISDMKLEMECDPAMMVWLRDNNIVVEFGGHTQSFVEESDLVVVSPGVPYESIGVQWAKARGIDVLGEIEFAFQFCDLPIIAVTGSNGKTTVATLIKDVLLATGHHAVLCGNVGYPFSSFLFDSQKRTDLPLVEYVVLEISSFQLESLVTESEHIKRFRPHIAIFLNFSQNHLDRHQDMDEYFLAKEKLFANQTCDDFAVLNFLDEKISGLESRIPAQIRYFNHQSYEVDSLNPNYLAVIEVAKILSLPIEQCRDVIASFSGVEHRLEFVRDWRGIRFINDSKATTVEAGRWALQQINDPIVLICGGRDKNLDFSLMKDVVSKKVRRVFVFGEAKKKIYDSFRSVVDVELCDDLQEAVAKAQNWATRGDCILLTPMCASFDMFSDFEARGQAFKRIVNSLT